MIAIINTKDKTVASRPPLPPFTRETAIQKIRLAEDGWNSRDPKKWLWPTRQIRARETDRSSRMAEMKPLPSLHASGQKNWTTG